jgi:hypothetical protein
MAMASARRTRVVRSGVLVTLGELAVVVTLRLCLTGESTGCRVDQSALVPQAHQDWPDGGAVCGGARRGWLRAGVE